MNSFPSLEYKELPPATSWKKALGVGVIITSLTVGTGELIMWPHLIVKFGLNLLWAALLGIIFQYFINQEVARHTLATGESFFTSSARISHWFTPFWFLSAFIIYIWPGWASVLGTVLKELTGFGDYIIWAWFSLLLVLFLTFIGRQAYSTLETTLKIIIPLFFIILLIVSFLNLDLVHIKDAFKSLWQIGWLPKEIDLSIFLSAVIFAGAGGLLNLCVSLWYRDKQAGMAKYVSRITNPITGKLEAVSATGFQFPLTQENFERWQKWMNLVKIDQGFIFAFIGFLTIFLISLNAFVVLTPLGLVPEGLQVVTVQANIFGKHFGEVGYKGFLLMTFLMLFSTMWTVIDAFTRIISDILYVNSQVGPFKNYLSFMRKFSIHYLYYTLIVLLVIIQMILIPFKAPLIYLIFSALLGALVMIVYIPLLIYLNNYQLPPLLRPGLITNLVLITAFFFYLILLMRTFLNFLT